MSVNPTQPSGGPQKTPGEREGPTHKIPPTKPFPKELEERPARSKKEDEEKLATRGPPKGGSYQARRGAAFGSNPPPQSRQSVPSAPPQPQIGSSSRYGQSSQNGPPIKEKESPKAHDKKDKEKGLAARQIQQESSSNINFASDKGMEISTPTQTSSGGGASPVDRIIHVFQTNSFFGSQVNTIQVSQQGSETIIGVALRNGVEVQINLAPGGGELNITIRGLTAAAQMAADNPENRLALASKLSEAGFIVHKIETFRAENLGPLPFTPPPQARTESGQMQPEGRPREEREGGRGGRDQQQDEEGERDEGRRR